MGKDVFEFESSKSSEAKDEGNWDEFLKEVMKSTEHIQTLVNLDHQFFQDAYMTEAGKELLQQFRKGVDASDDVKDLDCSDEFDEPSQVGASVITILPPIKSLELGSKTASTTSQPSKPVPVHVPCCQLVKQTSNLQKVMILAAFLDIASDFMFWGVDLNEDKVQDLRIWVLIFAVFGVIFQALSILRMRASLIRRENPYELMEKQICLSYMTLVFEDIPQMVLVIVATSRMGRWSDTAQLQLCFTILAIIEKTLRWILFQMNCLIVQEGVFTGVRKRWFGQTEIVEIARLWKYKEAAYEIFDEPDGRVIAHILRGYTALVMERGEDWMKIQMIPSVGNWVQKSVFHIVEQGYVKKQGEWWKNWTFEKIEMEPKYKFVKQTEPDHLLMSLYKSGPFGEITMKATKWSVSLVDTESIADLHNGPHRFYKYARLKMLPKTGGWTIAGEGYSGKGWTQLKNLNSGDTNWTIEAPIKRLTDYAENGLEQIAKVINSMRQQNIGTVFVLEKEYNLNHLAQNGIEPHIRDVGDNLIQDLIDPKRDLQNGATIFQVQDDWWKILTMKTKLPVHSLSEQAKNYESLSAELISKQHDSVAIVVSNESHTATFWSLGAKLETTSFDAINDALHRI